MSFVRLGLGFVSFDVRKGRDPQREAPEKVGAAYYIPGIYTPAWQARVFQTTTRKGSLYISLLDAVKIGENKKNRIKKWDCEIC